MKSFLNICALLLFCFSLGHSQDFNFYNTIDTVIQDQQIPDAEEQITTLDLTGSIEVMVLIIGFSDRTHTWPTISNDPAYPDEYYPHQGAFSDETTLREYIAVNGPLDVEDWVEPGFELYLDKYSGGKYTADAIFPKRSNGEPYLTIHNFQYWINLNGGSNDVVHNFDIEIIQEAAYNLLLDDPDAFDGIDMLQVSFVGITRCEFWCAHGGYTFIGPQTIRNPYNPNEIYYYGSLGISHQTGPILHEGLHNIGLAVGTPQGFVGLPDRGHYNYLDNYHFNATSTYDRMWNCTGLLPMYALYGNVPLLSYDLMFLGWIEEDEILEIKNQNITNIRLENIADPLTQEQIQGTPPVYRLIKVMIHENWQSNKDEYFLIEYHNANDQEINFDKCLHNLDEGLYNEGVLIWHIKEKNNMLNVFSDQYIDLELAQPYNGYYDNPIPDDDFPRDYERDSGWNGQWAGDFDWLDDHKWNNAIQKFYYLPDGGRNIWETTVPPEIYEGGHYPWDPTGEDWFYRCNSLRSDFFTDEEIRGQVVNNLTDITRPSAKDWAGDMTHIAILNIRRVEDYMLVDVYYNYWEGTLTEDETMSGLVTVGGNITVPLGITLTIDEGTTFNPLVSSNLIVYGKIQVNGGQLSFPLNLNLNLKPGSEMKFNNGASLAVNGTLIAQGTFQQQITFDFVNSQGNGISVRNGGTINLDYCKIKNAATGISTFHAANTVLVNHCTFENITGNGISVGANNQKLEVYNSTFSSCGSYCINIFGQMVTTPKIYYNHFQNTAYGILASSVNIVQINWNSFSNTQLGMSIIQVPDAHIIGNYLFSTLNLNSGIFFNNSNGYIRQNVIYGGHKRGISLANSSPKIGENQILFNKVNGIYASAGSVPDLRLFLGVSQTPGCPPYYYALSGCNEISDNGGYTQGPFGEVGDDGSEIYLSRSFILLDNGNNKIVDDRDEIPPLYHTLLLMNGTTNQDARIMARYNWWGLREVNRERFGTLSVIWEPIGADDCPVPPLAPCSLIVNGIDGMPIDTLYPVYDAEEFSDLDEEIAIADKYYMSGDYNNAISAYNNVVQNYPDSIQAFLAGSQLFIINKIQNSGLESFTALQNFYNTYAGNVSDTLLVKMIENLITLCYIGKEEYETAIGRLEDIIIQNPEEEEAIYAEIDAITAAMLANNGGGNLGKYAGKYAATSLDDYGSKIGELVTKLGSTGSQQNKEAIIPVEYKLYQNYPNPFNPITTIKYDIVKVQDVKLVVYDLLGREVATLVNAQQQPGTYEVSWNASNFASGIYFYTLTSSDFTSTRKLILLK